MFARTLSSLLQSYGKRFIQDLPEIKLSLWGGDVELRQLKLRNDVIEQLELNELINLRLLKGEVEYLKIHIPWKQITSSPIVVTLRDLTLELDIPEKTERSFSSSSSSSSSSIAIKKKGPGFAESVKDKKSEANDESSGWGDATKRKIQNNICFLLQNINMKIRSAGHEICLSIEEITFQSASHDWSPCFVVRKNPSDLQSDRGGGGGGERGDLIQSRADFAKKKEPGELNMLRKMVHVMNIQLFIVNIFESNATPLNIINRLNMRGRLQLFMKDKMVDHSKTPMGNVSSLPNRLDFTMDCALNANVSLDDIELLVSLLRCFVPNGSLPSEEPMSASPSLSSTSTSSFSPSLSPPRPEPIPTTLQHPQTTTYLADQPFWRSWFSNPVPDQISSPQTSPFTPKKPLKLPSEDTLSSLPQAPQRSTGHRFMQGQQGFGTPLSSSEPNHQIQKRKKQRKTYLLTIWIPLITAKVKFQSVHLPETQHPDTVHIRLENLALEANYNKVLSLNIGISSFSINKLSIINGQERSCPLLQARSSDVELSKVIDAVPQSLFDHSPNNSKTSATKRWSNALSALKTTVLSTKPGSFYPFLSIELNVLSVIADLKLFLHFFIFLEKAVWRRTTELACGPLGATIIETLRPTILIEKMGSRVLEEHIRKYIISKLREIWTVDPPIQLDLTLYPCRCYIPPANDLFDQSRYFFVELLSPLKFSNATSFPMEISDLLFEDGFTHLNFFAFCPSLVVGFNKQQTSFEEEEEEEGERNDEKEKEKEKEKESESESESFKDQKISSVFKLTFQISKRIFDNYFLNPETLLQLSLEDLTIDSHTSFFIDFLERFSAIADVNFPVFLRSLNALIGNNRIDLHLPQFKFSMKECSDLPPTNTFQEKDPSSVAIRVSLRGSEGHIRLFDEKQQELGSLGLQTRRKHEKSSLSFSFLIDDDSDLVSFKINSHNIHLRVSSDIVPLVARLKLIGKQLSSSPSPSSPSSQAPTESCNSPGEKKNEKQFAPENLRLCIRNSSISLVDPIAADSIRCFSSMLYTSESPDGIGITIKSIQMFLEQSTPVGELHSPLTPIFPTQTIFETNDAELVLKEHFRSFHVSNQSLLVSLDTEAISRLFFIVGRTLKKVSLGQDLIRHQLSTADLRDPSSNSDTHSSGCEEKKSRSSAHPSGVALSLFFGKIQIKLWTVNHNAEYLGAISDLRMELTHNCSSPETALHDQEILDWLQRQGEGESRVDLLSFHMICQRVDFDYCCSTADSLKILQLGDSDRSLLFRWIDVTAGLNRKKLTASIPFFSGLCLWQMIDDLELVVANLPSIYEDLASSPSDSTSPPPPSPPLPPSLSSSPFLPPSSPPSEVSIESDQTSKIEFTIDFGNAKLAIPGCRGKLEEADFLLLSIEKFSISCGNNLHILLDGLELFSGKQLSRFWKSQMQGSLYTMETIINIPLSITSNFNSDFGRYQILLSPTSLRLSPNHIFVFYQLIVVLDHILSKFKSKVKRPTLPFSFYSSVSYELPFPFDFEFYLRSMIVSVVCQDSLQQFSMVIENLSFFNSKSAQELIIKIFQMQFEDEHLISQPAATANNNNNNNNNNDDDDDDDDDDNENDLMFPPLTEAQKREAQKPFFRLSTSKSTYAQHLSFAEFAPIQIRVSERFLNFATSVLFNVMSSFEKREDNELSSESLLREHTDPPSSGLKNSTGGLRVSRDLLQQRRGTLESSEGDQVKTLFAVERYPLLQIQDSKEARSSGKIHIPSISLEFEICKQRLVFSSCDLFLIQTSVLGKSADPELNSTNLTIGRFDISLGAAVPKESDSRLLCKIGKSNINLRSTNLVNKKTSKSLTFTIPFAQTNISLGEIHQILNLTETSLQISKRMLDALSAIETSTKIAKYPLIWLEDGQTLRQQNFDQLTIFDDSPNAILKVSFFSSFSPLPPSPSPPSGLEPLNSETVLHRMKISLKFPEPRTILRFIIKVREKRSSLKTSSSISQARSSLAQTLTPATLLELFQFSVNYIDEFNDKPTQVSNFSVGFNSLKNCIELLLIPWRMEGHDAVLLSLPKGKPLLPYFSSQWELQLNHQLPLQSDFSVLDDLVVDSFFDPRTVPDCDAYFHLSNLVIKLSADQNESEVGEVAVDNSRRKANIHLRDDLLQLVVIKGKAAVLIRKDAKRILFSSELFQINHAEPFSCTFVPVIQSRAHSTLSIISTNKDTLLQTRLETEDQLLFSISRSLISTFRLISEFFQSQSNAGQQVIRKKSISRGIRVENHLPYAITLQHRRSLLRSLHISAYGRGRFFWDFQLSSIELQLSISKKLLKHQNLGDYSSDDRDLLHSRFFAVTIHQIEECNAWTMVEFSKTNAQQDKIKNCWVLLSRQWKADKNENEGEGEDRTALETAGSPSYTLHIFGNFLLVDETNFFLSSSSSRLASLHLMSGESPLTIDLPVRRNASLGFNLATAFYQQRSEGEQSSLPLSINLIEDPSSKTFLSVPEAQQSFFQLVKIEGANKDKVCLPHTMWLCSYSIDLQTEPNSSGKQQPKLILICLRPALVVINDSFCNLTIRSSLLSHPISIERKQVSVLSKLSSSWTNAIDLIVLSSPVSTQQKQDSEDDQQSEYRQHSVPGKDIQMILSQMRSSTLKKPPCITTILNHDRKPQLEDDHHQNIVKEPLLCLSVTALDNLPDAMEAAGCSRGLEFLFPRNLNPMISLNRPTVALIFHPHSSIVNESSDRLFLRISPADHPGKSSSFLSEQISSALDYDQSKMILVDLQPKQTVWMDQPVICHSPFSLCLGREKTISYSSSSSCSSSSSSSQSPPKLLESTRRVIWSSTQMIYRSKESLSNSHSRLSSLSFDSASVIHETKGQTTESLPQEQKFPFEITDLLDRTRVKYLYNVSDLYFLKPTKTIEIRVESWVRIVNTSPFPLKIQTDAQRKLIPISSGTLLAPHSEAHIAGPWLSPISPVAAKCGIVNFHVALVYKADSERVGRWSNSIHFESTFDKPRYAYLQGGESEFADLVITRISDELNLIPIDETSSSSSFTSKESDQTQEEMESATEQLPPPRSKGQTHNIQIKIQENTRPRILLFNRTSEKLKVEEHNSLWEACVDADRSVPLPPIPALEEMAVLHSSREVFSIPTDSFSQSLQSSTLSSSSNTSSSHRNENPHLLLRLSRTSAEVDGDYAVRSDWNEISLGLQRSSPTINSYEINLPQQSLLLLCQLEGDRVVLVVRESKPYDSSQKPSNNEGVVDFGFSIKELVLNINDKDDRSSLASSIALVCKRVAVSVQKTRQTSLLHSDDQPDSEQEYTITGGCRKFFLAVPNAPKLISTANSGLDPTSQQVEAIRVFVSFKHHENTGNYSLNCFSLFVEPLIANIDDHIIHCLLKLADSYSSAIEQPKLPNQKDPTDSFTSASDKRRPSSSLPVVNRSVMEQDGSGSRNPIVWIKSFDISAVNIILSINTSRFGIKISAQSIPVSLSPISMERLSLPLHSFAERVSKIYLNDMILLLPSIVGSLDIFGNPTNVLLNFYRGIFDLISLPLQQAGREGISGFARGVLHGSSSFAFHTATGALVAISAVSSSLQQNLELLNGRDADSGSLSSDHNYHHHHHHHHHDQITGVTSGIFLGMKNFGSRLYDGISGVLARPVTAAYVQGFRGFMGSFTRGLFDVVVKPTEGALGLLSSTSTGLLRSLNQPSAEEEEDIRLSGSLFRSNRHRGQNLQFLSSAFLSLLPLSSIRLDADEEISFIVCLPNFERRSTAKEEEEGGRGEVEGDDELMMQERESQQHPLDILLLSQNEAFACRVLGHFNLVQVDQVIRFPAALEIQTSSDLNFRWNINDTDLSLLDVFEVFGDKR